jgi:hypothetical protein
VLEAQMAIMHTSKAEENASKLNIEWHLRDIGFIDSENVQSLAMEPRGGGFQNHD